MTARLNLVFYDRTRYNLGVAALAAYLQASERFTAHGRVCVICNDAYPFRAAAARAEVRITAGHILAQQPDVVALSIFSYDATFLCALSRELKRCRPELVLVAGGIHPTLAPEATLHRGDFDYVVVGEGEEALLALVLGLIAGEVPVASIGNLVYRDAGGRIVANPARRFSGAPDDLPIPEYGPYLDCFGGVLPYLSARGCPFDCTYCANHRLRSCYTTAGARVRRRSPPRVLDDLRTLRRVYDFHTLFFFDDDFCHDRAWLEAFLPAYAESIGRPYFVFANPRSPDGESLALLARTGCAELKLGLQSLDGSLREEVCRRQERDAQVQQICAEARRLGLRVSVDLILGLPGDSAERIERTLPAASRLGVYKYVLYWLVLFPHTDILDIAVRRGLIDEARRDAINAGELSGLTHSLGTLTEHNRQFLPAAVMLSLLPLLPPRVSEAVIARRLYRAVPPSLWLCQVLDVLTALRHRDRPRLNEIGAFLRSRISRLPGLVTSRVGVSVWSSRPDPG